MSTPSELREAVLAALYPKYFLNKTALHEATNTLMSLYAARLEEVERERENLRLLICGGEDAPGYAASLSYEQIAKVAEDNRRSASRDAELAWDGETANSWKARAQASEAREAALREALKDVGKQADNWFAPWGAWKTAWWEDFAPDDAAMSEGNFIKAVANFARRKAELLTKEGA